MTVRQQPFTIRDGAGLAAGAVALHYMTEGMALRLRAPMWVTELVGVAAMAGVALYAARHALRERLAIVTPRFRYIAAAVMFGFGAPVVIAWVPITRWLGLAPDLTWKHEAEHEMLWQSLLWIAFLGPIAEELAFRGLLVRSLATKWPAWRAVVVSAFLFALYHHSPHQFFGPICFGAMTGYLVLRSGSIVPGIIAHICNNLWVTLRNYDMPEKMWTQIFDHIDTLNVVCAFFVFTSIWMIRRE